MGGADERSEEGGGHHRSRSSALPNTLPEMDFDSIPYAPGGLGPLGHNADFRKDRLGSLQRLTGQAGLVRLRLPIRIVRAVIANHPDAAQEVLVEKAKLFNKSDMLRFSLFPLAGEGIFTSNGELWRRQRKLMAPMFQPKALEGFIPDMVEATHRTMEGWADGREVALNTETTRLTMAVAGKTLFGADTFSEADDLGHALTVALDWAGWIIGRPLAVGHIVARRFFADLAEEGPSMLRGPARKAALELRGPAVLFGSRGRELARSIETLDQQVQRMIDERRRSTARSEDLLTRLLEARDDDGEKMSDRQTRDEILTLFVAGHETTATGLAWTIYEACRNPEIYAAMEREADALGDAPTFADIEKLDVCLRAFKEALRLYPPVYMFGRDSAVPVSVMGYDLPRPTNVMISPWVMHRLQPYWPDPERFDPDRFLPAEEAKRHRYAYLPFSAGPRICLGIHFAYMEAPLVLATMMKRYRFELLAPDVPEPSATLRPKHGVRVRLKRRERSGRARQGRGERGGALSSEDASTPSSEG